MAAVVIGPPGRLELARLPVPRPGAHDVLLQVGACGVCRTDLHILDGDLAPHRRRVVPGHEVVGRVVARGSQARRFAPGQRLGVPWLGGICQRCPYCAQGLENLCDRPSFTGYDRDGGFAEYIAADERFCFALPERYDDAHAAPLLCAGLIGYRAFAMAAPDGPLGIYGFGAAAHIITQLAARLGRTVFAFTRPGDTRTRQFAHACGAAWAGDCSEAPPELLNSAIIFAPAGELVPQALAHSRKGATIVCAGIHMSDIPAFPYRLLWGERCVRSVANLTRSDGEAFLRLADAHRLHTMPVLFPLQQAAVALAHLRSGSIEGAAVLVPEAGLPDSRARRTAPGQTAPHPAPAPD